MPLYEHVYLARQDLSQQQVDELTAQYKGIIEQLGGKVAKAEYWGVKSLTYRIRKNRKAHFTLMNIDAPPPAINEIEPNSPMARAKASPKPPSTAGHSDGRTTHTKVRTPPAPSDLAAASASPSSEASTGWTARTEKGSVTNKSATMRPIHVSKRSIFKGLAVP